ncbi:hypothetical protein V6N13_144072 [Hibiscus sabdariffa]
MFSDGDPFPYDSLMAWTVWGIWKACNAWIFDGSRENPIHIWNSIFKEFEEFQHHKIFNRSNSNPSRDSYCWLPPPQILSRSIVMLLSIVAGNLQVESDCKLAIDMINGQSLDSWDVKVVLSDIRLSVEPLSNVTFSCICRTSNQVVDWVAQTTCKGTYPYNWMRLIPHELLSLM